MVTVAVPLVTVQAPVPEAGLLPARVKLPLLHWVWSFPAAAVVGNGEFATLAVLLVEVHEVVAFVPIT